VPGRFSARPDGIHRPEPDLHVRNGDGVGVSVWTLVRFRSMACPRFRPDLFDAAPPALQATSRAPRSLTAQVVELEVDLGHPSANSARPASDGHQRRGRPRKAAPGAAYSTTLTARTSCLSPRSVRLGYDGEEFDRLLGPLVAGVAKSRRLLLRCQQSW
jgi:hypothetical protein